jgi:hypothetical protein
MADEETTEEQEGPTQTILREPQENEIGPFFPSGMSAPEAAVAGATANMSEAEIASLKGEKVETETSEPEQRPAQTKQS